MISVAANFVIAFMFLMAAVFFGTGTWSPHWLDETMADTIKRRAGCVLGIITSGFLGAGGCFLYNAVKLLKGL